MSQPKNSTKKSKTIECVICGESLTQYSIGMHVKKYHNLDPEKYKIDNGLKIEKRKPLNCKFCGNTCHLRSKKGVCSNEECKSKQKAIDKQEYILSIVKESNEKFNDHNKNEWVECRECGYRTSFLTILHLKAHNITVEEYKNKYPDAELMSESEKGNISVRVSGEKNPGFQHGGTLSPFSKNFVGYEDLSDEEIERRITEMYSFHDDLREKDKYNCRLGWYINQGYTEEKAEKLLSERQSTFNYEKCIEKYGEEEGIRVWRERQDKWQNTLNSKPDEEISRINSSKSFVCKNNLSVGFQATQYLNSNKEAQLYVFIYKPKNIDKEYIKFGITKRRLTDRWKSILIKEVLIQYYASSNDIFLLENKIKTWAHNNKLIIEPENRFPGWTECVELSHKENLLEHISEIIKSN